MTTNVPGWTTLAENPLVLVREYSFGPGTANAMVVGLPNGDLMITSPPTDVPREELSALNAHGKVVALLEFNGAHHLGLPVCRPCFPDAVTYAMPRAAARIQKKAKDPGKIEPIEALQPLLGDKVKVIPVAGDKLGDVLVRVDTEKGKLLYAGDFFANIRELPKNLLFRLIFKLTDSGPGFKVFGIFFKMFVADRKAARDALIREVESNPPAVLIPAHGEVVTRSDLGPTLVSMLRAAVS
jgi:hypothetical protein